jgi:hypothetical protein
LKRPGCSIRLLIGISAVCLAGVASAQESLDRGKSPAQLFASHCSACHKSPQGLAKSGGLFGLDGFLLEHYMTSRETAVAMSNYLRAMDTGPARPGRASKRAAKGDDKAKVDGSKKPAAKPGQNKTDTDGGDSRSSGARPLDGKPADILAPEPRVAEPRPRAPAAGEARPADGAKSDKSDKSEKSD